MYEQVDAILGETLTSTFMKKKNKDVCLLLNIESVAAVNRLGELLAIPGTIATSSLIGTVVVGVVVIVVVNGGVGIGGVVIDRSFVLYFVRM